MLELLHGLAGASTTLYNASADMDKASIFGRCCLICMHGSRDTRLLTLLGCSQSRWKLNFDISQAEEQNSV